MPVMWSADESASRRQRLLKLLLTQQGHRVPDGGRIPQADRTADVPLSFAQQRIWVLDRLLRQRCLYNAPLAYRLRGPLDVEALEDGFTRLVARHEALRTTFAERNGGPVQVIGAPYAVHADVVPMRSATHGELDRLVRQEATRPFDLARGPLLRLTIVALAPEEHVLLITMHHIVTDTWSVGVMFRELTVLYEAARDRQAPRGLPELPVQYADFAVWQRQVLSGDRLGRELDYWTDRLRGAPGVLTIPTDRPRPTEPSFSGAELSFTVPSPLAGRLRAFATELGATMFMVLLAGFTAQLARYAGTTDVVIGSPVAGRHRVEVEPLIGFFVNNLVLRTDLAGDPSFTELVQRVRRVALDAYEHQDLPFERLVDELQPERQLSVHPLAQVNFQVYEPQNLGSVGLSTAVAAVPDDHLTLPGLAVEPLPTSTATSKFDLSVIITEEGGALTGSIEYATELYDEETIARFTENYVALLEGAAAAPGSRLSDLPAMATKQLRQVVDGWSGEIRRVPDGPCLHDMVRAQCARTPDALAVIGDGTEHLTYRQLMHRADVLAFELRGHGVGPDAIVGICAERSVATVVAQLAVLVAGGAFLPIDPDQPIQRVAELLTEARAVLLLAGRSVLHTLPASLGTPVRELPVGGTPAGVPPTGPPPPVAGPSHLAYAIFTSGSTGRPKCVVTPHEGVVNLMAWARHEYELTPADRMLHKAPFSFDVSVWEVFWPLTAGAAVVLVRPDGHRDLRYLAELIQRHNVTTAHFVPTVLRAFMTKPAARRCTSLRRVICGGEALTTDLVEGFYTAFAGMDVVLHNQYGPAEASVQVTAWPLRAGSARVALGRAVWNTRMYVLDDALRPVPCGVPGELYLAGVHLARAYLHQPGLTADRFVPDPFGSAGTRMYRTGDLVRWLADGTLEYLGRTDHQLKIRGFRVEPSEIKARLMEHPTLREAVLVAWPPGGVDKQLVAYVVPHGVSGDADLTTDLRQHLAQRLPRYMVPTWIVVLDSLPLNQNGKVDVAALPDPAPTGRPTFEAPRTPAEQALGEVWCAVLRLDAVGIQDNFFALGGDSIRAIEVSSRAAAVGLRVSPNQMFQHQTLVELAAVASEEDDADPRAGTATVGEEDTTGPVPLTPIQRSFFDTGDPERDHLAQYVTLAVDRALDPEVIDRGLDSLVRHHEALRYRYQPTYGWRPIIEPHRPGRRLRRAVAPTDGVQPLLDAELPGLLDSLDPARGELLTAVLFDRPTASPLLLLVIHHLCVDAVSWRILREDLESACRQLADGVPEPQLAAGTTSFSRWARRLDALAGSDELALDAQRWRQLLPRTVQPLPRDGVEPEVNDRYGDVVHVDTMLSRKDTEALHGQVPVAYRMQAHEVVLAALVLACHRWTGTPGLLIDLEGHGREQIFADLDVTRTVGWFTSVFPVHVALSDLDDVEACLLTVKETIRALPGRGLSFGLLRDADEPSRNLGDLPTADIQFNYLGRLDAKGERASLFTPEGEPLGLAVAPGRPRRYPIEVYAYVDGGKLLLRWAVNPSVHDPSTLVELGKQLVAAVREIVELAHRSDAGAVSPSDFPLAGLSAADLRRHFGAARDVEDIYPLSSVQEGLLFQTLAGREPGMYLTQASWDVGQVDAPVLAQAWQEVVRRNPILRTRLTWKRVRQPLQVLQREAIIPVTFVDWSALPADEQEHALDRLLREGVRAGMNLEQAPLLRITLARTSSTAWRIVLECHHILLDGWSVVMLLADVRAVYDAILAGSGLRLPVRRPFRDYIAWHGGRDAAADRSYWTAQLAGFRSPTPLPLGGPDPAAEGQGAHTLSLPSSFAADLDRFARQVRVTPSTVFQAAWSLLLGQHAESDDVVFGVTVSGRSGMPGMENMIGLLINTLPLRVRIPTDGRLDEWLRGLQASRAELPSEHTSLADITGWSELPPRQPLFDSILVYENYPVDEQTRDALGGLSSTVLRVDEIIHFPLRCVVNPGPPFEAQLRYDRRRVRPEQVARIAQNLAIVLTGMVTAADQRTGDLRARLRPYR
ncbi:hypothetical protein TPA0907_56970 [Micromonospora humidisoli]|nr:hypothetical protein TPA0907_56970 [Micromonospora sp. AKA109]